MYMHVCACMYICTDRCMCLLKTICLLDMSILITTAVLELTSLYSHNADDMLSLLTLPFRQPNREMEKLELIIPGFNS